MKNLFLTAVLALSTLAASAQFMVVTTYDGDQTENMDKITANMGFGYTVMDGITVGLVRAPGSDAVAADSAAGIVSDDDQDGIDHLIQQWVSNLHVGCLENTLNCFREKLHISQTVEKIISILPKED